MILKKIFLYFYFLVCLFGLIACARADSPGGLKTIAVGGHKLKVEIADSQRLRSQGLSNRENLSQNQGMLFIFESYSRPGFWMKDMLIPIDIIWIRDNTIIDLTQNIPAPTPPGPDLGGSASSGSLPSYFPKEDINYVLEVNAGWCDRYKIKIGDSIVLR